MSYDQIIIEENKSIDLTVDYFRRSDSYERKYKRQEQYVQTVVSQLEADIATILRDQGVNELVQRCFSDSMNEQNRCAGKEELYTFQQDNAKVLLAVKTGATFVPVDLVDFTIETDSRKGGGGSSLSSSTFAAGVSISPDCSANTHLSCKVLHASESDNTDLYSLFAGIFRWTQSVVSAVLAAVLLRIFAIGRRDTQARYDLFLEMSEALNILIASADVSVELRRFALTRILPANSKLGALNSGSCDLSFISALIHLAKSSDVSHSLNSVARLHLLNVPMNFLINTQAHSLFEARWKTLDALARVIVEHAATQRLLTAVANEIFSGYVGTSRSSVNGERPQDDEDGLIKTLATALLRIAADKEVDSEARIIATDELSKYVLSLAPSFGGDAGMNIDLREAALSMAGAIEDQSGMEALVHSGTTELYAPTDLFRSQHMSNKIELIAKLGMHSLPIGSRIAAAEQLINSAGIDTDDRRIMAIVLKAYYSLQAQLSSVLMGLARLF